MNHIKRKKEIGNYFPLMLILPGSNPNEAQTWFLLISINEHTFKVIQNSVCDYFCCY